VASCPDRSYTVHMRDSARTWRAIGVPVALVGLAVVMPIDGAAPPAPVGQWADRAVCQANGLGAQVTQAARDFCGSGAMPADITPASPFLPAAGPSLGAAQPAPPDRLPTLGRVSPHLVNLPPPHDC